MAAAKPLRIMRSFFRSFVASLTAASFVAASTLAAAQAAPAQAAPAQAAPAQAAAPAAAPPPVVIVQAPPASNARAANGEYVAPLSQQTQSTYIPQSVALSGPAEFSYDDGQPIPDGYHLATRVRKGAIIGGAVPFGTLYLLSALTAAGNADANPRGENPASALYIPAIGPFIQMGHTSTQSSGVLLAIDGIGQTAGLILLIYGLTSPKQVLVRNDLAKPMIAPMHMGQNGYGLGVVGTF